MRQCSSNLLAENISNHYLIENNSRPQQQKTDYLKSTIGYIARNPCAFSVLLTILFKEYSTQRSYYPTF